MPKSTSTVKKGIVTGIKVTADGQYKTTDGRTFANANHANRYQTNQNRIANIKAVLRGSGLLAYRNNENILSVGPLAANLTNPDFLNRLINAANSRTKRKHGRVAVTA
jgi:hypothetical protein